MKKILPGLLLLAFTGQILSAQTDTAEYMHRPFQFTFMFHPLSTNGAKNAGIINNISLNLFVGISGGVENFEAGSFINVDRYYVKGAQIAGFGNTVGGFASAAQLAGIYNVTGSCLKGFQGAGLVNVAGKSAVGVQAAGFVCVAGAGMKGVQLSGFFNAAGGTVEGFQGAGFFNTGGAADQCVQVAGFGNRSGEGRTSFQGAGFFNMAGEVKGAQLAGFANIAGHVEGVQAAGFLNICDSIDGVPLGFINIVRKNGYRKVVFSVSEIQYANLSFRMGVRRLYNIYSFGKPSGPGSRWMFGGGLGSEFDLNERTILNIEATVHQELWIAGKANPYFLNIGRFNQYNTLKFLFGWNMDNQVSLHVGPTFNVSVADTDEYSGTVGFHEIPFYSVFSHTGPGHTTVQMWFGLQGSISF
jgi:hypothetical protein